MASAIERGVALPVGQVPGEVVPFLVLQFEIGRHIRAETFIQELGGLQRPQRVEQVERSRAVLVERALSPIISGSLTVALVKFSVAC
jgi:hypothetical protein